MPLTMEAFHKLLGEFIPQYDATVDQHLIFADYLEEMGETNLALSIRHHSSHEPNITYAWFFLITDEEDVKAIHEKNQFQKCLDYDLPLWWKN